MRRLLACLFLLLFSVRAYAAVNVNTADASELETLPGIGASKAAAIIQYRADHGPFKTVDDLDNVSGIGPSTLANIRDLVTVGSGSTATSASASTSAGTTTTSTTAPPLPTSSESTSTAAPTSTASAGTSGSGCPVNINAADATWLEDLPGIGASKSAAILQYRTDNGPFKSCDDLDNVSGIGPATIAGLRECCAVK